MEERTELETAQGANRILKERLANYRNLVGSLIEKRIKSAANGAGAKASAMEDIIGRGVRVFKTLEDGSSIEPRDENGQLVYGSGSASLITVDGWIGGLKKSADHLFELKTKKPGGGQKGLEDQLEEARERKDLPAQIRLKRLISAAQREG